MPDIPRLYTLDGQPQTWEELFERLEALTWSRRQKRLAYADWRSHRTWTA